MYLNYEDEEAGGRYLCTKKDACGEEKNVWMPRGGTYSGTTLDTEDASCYPSDFKGEAGDPCDARD